MSNNPYAYQTDLLLQTIVKAQSCFIKAESISQSFDGILDNLLALTQSEYGFIGEVLHTQEETPYLQTHAITNIAWNEETRNLYNQYAPNLEFTNLENLFGKVITTGKPVIANNPGMDTRSGGLPQGHPPLNAFLGVPFFHGDKLVGMAGISNRPGGYDEELVEFLKPLLTYCGTLIEANRNEQYRCQTERALRESEERLSLVLDASGSGVWDWNIQTGEVYYSKNWLESLGYKPEEVPPNIEFWKDLVHPEDWPKVMFSVSEHFEGKTDIYECENRLRMASGEWRWNFDRGRVIEWDVEGKPLRMVGTDLDISNRKRLEEKNLNLQYALDHGREGFALLDEKGRFTYLNLSHAEQYGYEINELMGQSWESLYAPHQTAYVYEVCFPALDDHGWWHGELKGTKKNGQSFDVEVFLTLLRNSKNEPNGFLCTCRDISTRKQLEATRRASEQGIRELHDIASHHQATWDERISSLLEMGCRRFNLSIGVLTKLNDGMLRFEGVHDPKNEVAVGLELPADQIFCGHSLKTLQPLSFEHAGMTEWKKHPGYELLGMEAYIGAPVFVGDQPYGTIAFVCRFPAENPFVDADRDFIQLMAQWVGKELSRQHSMNQLRESEQRFDLAVWGSNDGIWDWPNIEEDTEWWSPKFYELLGYSFEEIPASLSTFVKLLHPDDRDRVFQAVESHLKKDMPFDCEYRLQLKIGTYRWFRARGKAVRAHNGVATRMVGSIQDIHERHQSEISLRESEAKLQAILDGSSSVIYVKNLEGRYELVNRRYEELFNVTNEDMKQKTDYDVFSPQIAEKFQGNDRLVQISQQNLVLEEIAPHPDGLHTYISNKFPLFNHEGILYATCGISTDITDRKRIELALRESESRFRSMADTAPVLIWMSDSEKNCTYVNQVWLDFTGRTLEQELGHGWADNIHPEDWAGCLEICQKGFQARTPFEMEFRLKNHAGEYRWVVDRGVPRFDSDGTFLGFIGSCLDISQQKLLEQNIRHYNQLLHDEVKARTLRIQELEQRRMQVEKLAALSQITAGIAHEINNPLASIQQSLHLVKRIVPPEHPRAKYMQKIDQEIGRIAHIIKQMYQLYQPQQEYPRSVSLNQVTKEARNLITSLHRNKGVQVQLELQEDILELPLPATELHQVLCNLLQNAFDAIESHGMVLIRTGVNSAMAWIEVQDDGPGITSKTLSQIFDPFFSTKVSHERKGMGLGLSVSKSLVEAMGGRIRVESTPGQGALFIIEFSLPIIPTFPESVEEESSCQVSPIS